MSSLVLDLLQPQRNRLLRPVRRERGECVARAEGAEAAGLLGLYLCLCLCLWLWLCVRQDFDYRIAPSSVLLKFCNGGTADIAEVLQHSTACSYADHTCNRVRAVTACKPVLLLNLVHSA